jgi:hypothetical protein
MAIQNFEELSEYMAALAGKNNYIKQFKCCDYDEILANQTNIKYPCLWMESVPSLRQDDEGIQDVFSFTVSILYQEETLEKNRLGKNMRSLEELVEIMARVKDEADDNEIDIKGAEYECDFSLSNDKDMRWRVELKVTINACSEVHPEKWSDL